MARAQLTETVPGETTTREVDLLGGAGAATGLTLENVRLYAGLYAHYKMVDSCRPSLEALRAGFLVCALFLMNLRGGSGYFNPPSGYDPCGDAGGHDGRRPAPAAQRAAGPGPAEAAHVVF